MRLHFLNEFVVDDLRLDGKLEGIFVATVHVTGSSVGLGGADGNVLASYGSDWHRKQTTLLCLSGEGKRHSLYSMILSNCYRDLSLRI